MGKRCGVAVVLALMTGCAQAPPEPPPTVPDSWGRTVEVLRPLCRPLGRPGPLDWLACHAEPGQTFEQYRRSQPVTLTQQRHRCYVQPLGWLSPPQQRIVDTTARCLGQVYHCPVTTLAPLPLTVVPGPARRVPPHRDSEQLLTTYLLDEVLRPRLPADAAVYLAFTAADLWPGEGWHFVFGQASLQHRVGVWSLHRFGDPNESPDAAALCRRRTLALAVHETGHMFSLQHCIAYECVMCGCNHLPEADRHPLHFCAECLPKIWWATGARAAPWLAAQQAVMAELGLTREASFYAQARKVLPGS